MAVSDALPMARERRPLSQKFFETRSRRNCRGSSVRGSVDCMDSAVSVAVVASYLALPWWGLAVLIGAFMLLWDWLWGQGELKKPSTSLLMVVTGALGILASYVLARNLGITLHEFVSLRASAPRRADWLYWLPGIGLALVVYGMALRLMQLWEKP